MKISTEIDSLMQIVGIEKAIELLAKAGFDAWDLSLYNMFPFDWSKDAIDYQDHPLCKPNALQYAKKLKQISDDNGIVCNQSHAPFPVSNKEVRSLLPFSLECTALAGGNICIIHPDNNKSAEENAEMYFELLPIAKDFGVKIATENMWNWDHDKNHARAAACSDPKSFLEHLNVVNDDYLIACLDIGHAEMKGLNTSAVEMILALGDKLQALHLHDNDKIHDDHLLPFTMNIDFNQVCKALKEINYSGYFTLETINFLKKYDQTNVFEGVKTLAKTANKLVDLYNN